MISILELCVLPSDLSEVYPGIIFEYVNKTTMPIESRKCLMVFKNKSINLAHGYIRCSYANKDIATKIKYIGYEPVSTEELKKADLLIQEMGWQR